MVMHGGLGLDHTTFCPWLDPLGDTLQLVYYDHRGNGRSDRVPVETITLEQLAADADELRAVLGFERVAVLGHSAGGMIALTYALSYPERISHLILVDTAPAFDYGEEIMANARHRGATDEMMAALEAPSPSDDEEFRGMFELIMPLYFHRFDESLGRQLIANTISSGLAAASTEAFLPGYNVVPQLAQIQAPTLILTGRDDFITPPSQGQRMHEGIPNSEVAILDHSGHFAYVEEPEALLDAIRRWFVRVR
jgi:proline iminopeptidase